MILLFKCVKYQDTATKISNNRQENILFMPERYAPGCRPGPGG